MGLFDKHLAYAQAYEAIRNAGADPFNVKFEQVLSPTEGIIDGRRTILLGSHNYLGLTFDPTVLEAAAKALTESGAGTTGSRIANGNFDGHRRLESELARFYGRKHAMVFTTGYQANLGMLSSLVGRGDHLILDADSHASIYDASRLGMAEVIRFRHNDPEDLYKRLKRLQGVPGDRLIVVEGIYSMLGDIAPLKEMVAVKREMGAYLLVDEAHSMGVLGEKGRGLAEVVGVEEDVDFVVGTFSKSLAGIGGFCVSNLDGFEVMRVTCRPYMFTASLPPATVASTTAALHRMETDPGLRQRVMANAKRLYDGLNAMGFVTGPTCNPIVAIALPDQPVAIGVWNALMKAGVYMNLALPPATPDMRPLLRASVSAAHSDEQIDAVLAMFKQVGEAFGLIEGDVKRVATA
ncbi:serine palmitoyltransferase [Caulobacter sp. NIBR2454]|uniref:serine palmitoyltransferase n=1 Tax=Caulobacter sp. NIBR2454 TaxID=3015996 RepID=UPI0022B6B3AD|nr:pyridoxal phosphate-dependent aminotransferase family protein [Caulobacter sp. NIBR2454]